MWLMVSIAIGLAFNMFWSKFLFLFLFLWSIWIYKMKSLRVFKFIHLSIGNSSVDFYFFAFYRCFVFNYLNILVAIYCRFTSDVGQLKLADSGDQREASALRDEVCHSYQSLIVDMQLLVFIEDSYKLVEPSCFEL